MTKQDVIWKFREACTYPENKARRKLAVETQYDRTKWEIPHQEGLIRIQFFKGLYSIVMWPVLGKSDAPAGERVAIKSFQLFEQEYLALKVLYFGNYKPDEKYLRKLSAEYAFPKKPGSGVNFIYIPLGVGFTLLLLYTVGARPLKGTIIFFVATIVFWIGHEIFKKIRR
jgi:hypothetical protein